MKDKAHIIISIDAEKVFNIIQIGRQENSLKITEGIYDIVVSGGTQTSGPIRELDKDPAFSTCIHHWNILAKAIRQEIA